MEVEEFAKIADTKGLEAEVFDHDDDKDGEGEGHVEVGAWGAEIGNKSFAGVTADIGAGAVAGGGGEEGSIEGCGGMECET